MSIIPFESPEWLGEETDAKTINRKMLATLPDNIDKTEGGFIWDFTMPCALEKAELLQYYLPLALQAMFHMWASGQWLDYHAKEESIERRPATYAYGYVTVEGIAGVEIPQDFVFSVPSENGVAAIDYYTLEAATIPESGIIKIPIQAVESGPSSNVANDMITIMKNPLKNITRITNEEAITGGTIAEDDDSLRERIDDVIAGRGESMVGSPADYERWALEVAGVGQAYCIPTYNGKNSVKIVVIDANGQPANEQLLKAVEVYIFGTYEKDPARLAPVGVYDYLVAAPAAIPVNISLDLKLKSGATLEEVKTNIKTALYKYYAALTNERDLTNREEIVLTELRYVKVSAVLENATGVADFKHLRINGGLNNIIFAEDEFPVTGTIEARVYE